MIFGKTQEQKNAEERASNIKKILGQREFHMICKLADGRWAFWQHVWAYYKAFVHQTGKVDLCTEGFGFAREYYLDKSPDFVHVLERVPEYHSWQKSTRSPSELFPGA